MNAPFVIDEVDPVWTNERDDYYTRLNLQTPGEAAVHWLNIIDPPPFIED